MKYIINKKEHSPVYLQLYRQLRDDIVQEIYPYDSKLPSKRIISEELGISTVTTEHAYSLLCDEGYIESRQRSGYFVTFRTGDGFAYSANKGILHIPVQQHHENTAAHEFPFSVLAKTMRKVISDLGENLLDRSPNYGCTQLRQAICQYLARSRGIHAEPDQIIIGSGSEYLYGLIVELLGRKHIYAIESPSYKKIQQVYTAAEIKYEMLPLEKDGIRSSALSSTKADVLHITPYRSFPSGVTATASKRHEYIRWASKHNRYIIEDDFESEFSVSTKPEETLFSHTKDDNVIYMNTFSKTISPALRVGYMVLPRHLVSIYEGKMSFYSCTVPTFEQFVLTELILSGDFERHINRVRRQKRKDAL